MMLMGSPATALAQVTFASNANVAVRLVGDVELLTEGQARLTEGQARLEQRVEEGLLEVQKDQQRLEQRMEQGQHKLEQLLMEMRKDGAASAVEAAKLTIGTAAASIRATQTSGPVGGL